MKIAFDLDGVVLDQDMGFCRMVDLGHQEDQQELMKYYCNHRPLQLNPIDFLADDDELFFITGRSILVEELTLKWAKKYFPMAKVIITRLQHPSRDTILMTSNYGKVGEGKSWNKLQAERKAKAIIDNEIDVYFDDNPEVVKHLREMCDSRVKIVQYGGRVF